MSEEKLSRRHFLGALAAAAAGTTLTGRALAQTPAKVAVDDPTAKSLAYTEDASKIDAAKEPAYKKGAHCASCSLYQAAQAKGGYAPCAIFAGKLVNQNGWCRAYAAKA